jgi:hypothetical protein
MGVSSEDTSPAIALPMRPPGPTSGPNVPTIKATFPDDDPKTVEVNIKKD